MDFDPTYYDQMDDDRLSDPQMVLRGFEGMRYRDFVAHVDRLPTADVLALAQEVTQRRLEPPTLDLYRVVEAQLDYMQAFEAAGVEPSDDERERVTVGVIAARNFDDVDPWYGRVLSVASYRFRHRGQPLP